MSRAATEGKVPKPSELVEVWLTCDTDTPGIVEVWSWQPQRIRCEDGTSYWWVEGTGELLDRFTRLAALKRFRTLPDDDRQCVRLWTKGVW